MKTPVWSQGISINGSRFLKLRHFLNLRLAILSELF